MPGPAPTPAAARRRRNAAPNTRKLPAGGRTEPAPTWPLLGRAPRRWAALWALPEAAAWGPGDVQSAAHFVKTSMTVERLLSVAGTTGKVPPGLSSMQSEIRQLGDRLGLSPMAKLRLRWELTTDEVAEKRDEQAEAAPSAPVPAKRRLKVAGS